MERASNTLDGTTEKIQSLTVDGSGIFPLRFITAKPTGEEQGELSDSAEVDLDVGDTNDFEINTAVSEYDAKRIGYGCKIFIPGTEYGGIIGDIESNANEEKVVIRGRTWRGMLQYKVRCFAVVYVILQARFVFALFDTLLRYYLAARAWFV